MAESFDFADGLYVVEKDGIHARAEIKGSIVTFCFATKHNHVVDFRNAFFGQGSLHSGCLKNLYDRFGGTPDSYVIPFLALQETPDSIVVAFIHKGSCYKLPMSREAEDNHCFAIEAALTDVILDRYANQSGEFHVWITIQPSPADLGSVSWNQGDWSCKLPDGPKRIHSPTINLGSSIQPFQVDWLSSGDQGKGRGPLLMVNLLPIPGEYRFNNGDSPNQNWSMTFWQSNNFLAVSEVIIRVALEPRGKDCS